MLFRSRKGPRERVLLILMSIGFVGPLLWVASPLLRFADRVLLPAPFAMGVVLIVAGLALLQRSHAALGKNWSITLELRENHQLVTRGLHRHVRHPMYSALLLYAVGLALALPNWLAGLSYLAAVIALVGLRLAPEEQMMLERFGEEYEAYMQRTKRLIPGVW